MKLQILVPQYKETDEVIKPLLTSIALQQSINFDDLGIVIVNDGSDVHLSEEFLNSFPFKVEYYLNEHKGVSATRNACLDHATADYVMFCDADDMFYNMCGLYIVMREINGDGFDTLMSAFTEETRDPKTKNIVYVNRDVDSTFVHGKIHRRQYLIDNNIRWNDELTIHEDSYFNCLCQHLTKEVKYCGIPFYLWKWRDESVCRHDPDYILKTYNNMLESNTALVHEFQRRRKFDDAKFFATNMIFDAYYTLNKKEWINQNNKHYREAVERRFVKYWKEFKNLYEELDEEKKIQVIAGVRTRMFGEGLMLESVTFDDWIRTITKKYK